MVTYMSTNQKKLLALKNERAALNDRINDVIFSLGSEEIKKLSKREVLDLNEQLSYMKSYSWVLHKRIMFIEQPGVHHTEGVVNE